jgi:hypothetical protein
MIGISFGGLAKSHIPHNFPVGFRDEKASTLWQHQSTRVAGFKLFFSYPSQERFAFLSLASDNVRSFSTLRGGLLRAGKYYMRKDYLLSSFQNLISEFLETY